MSTRVRPRRRRRDLPFAAGDTPLTLTEIGEADDEVGALTVLRRGLATSPELKTGAAFTIGMALAEDCVNIGMPILFHKYV